MRIPTILIPITLLWYNHTAFFSNVNTNLHYFSGNYVAVSGICWKVRERMAQNAAYML